MQLFVQSSFHNVFLIAFCATIYALRVAFVDLVALYTLKYEQLPQYGGILE